jgi:heavy metal translocating P-type ATPase
MTFKPESVKRSGRLALVITALTALVVGLVAAALGHVAVSKAIWAFGTMPVIASLIVTMTQAIRAGRLGVDAIALLSMVSGLALGENLAALVVAIMYAGGQGLEEYAIGRAERDLKSLVDRAPRFAHRRTKDGFEEIPVDAVLMGDAILVRAGEIVPADGIVTSADAMLDESAVTGESIPVHRRPGEGVRSGTLNAGEAFGMRATATAGESTYAGIVRMVTAAQVAKPPFIRVADRYGLLLLPATLAVAGTAWWFSGDTVRALAVLVVATPCPLILAAPVAFIAGVSQAARNGILIKGGGPLEALANTQTVMFDKTGTLTVGGARLIAIETTVGMSSDEVLRLAGSVEQASNHVVATTIVKAALARGLALEIPLNVKETLGAGIEGRVAGRALRVGAADFVYGQIWRDEWALRVLRRASWRSALSVFVSIDGKSAGALLLGDELRRETPSVIHALRKAGVSRIVMVTGDRADAAETIGAALDLDGVLADRVPSDKVDAVAAEQRARPTMMVGDGINDAPALAAANVGIALGARGATASSQAADVVVLVDRLDRVSQAVGIAKRTRTIAIQSIAFGMGLSGVAMGFAAVGMLKPVAGALTQEAIDIAVVLNALRALLPPLSLFRRSIMPTRVADALRSEHEHLNSALNRLRDIADALDDAAPENAAALIAEANQLVRAKIAPHERADETRVYPQLTGYLTDDYGLSAMSRAHREIIHLSRLIDGISTDLTPQKTDHYLVRDAQRLIETIESLVRIHSAQEEDIYEQAAGA